MPLDSQSRVIVLVAAANKKGAAFGYFFKFESNVEFNQSNFDTLLPDMAIVKHKFGDLGIYNGEWPLVGKVNNFDPVTWPASPCVQKDEQAGIALIHYFDTNTFRTTKIGKVDIEDPSIQLLPENSLWGHKVAEVIIKRLLIEN